MSLPGIVLGHPWKRCNNLQSPPCQGYGDAIGQQQWWIGLLAFDLRKRQWLEFHGPSQLDHALVSWAFGVNQ